MSDKKRTIVSDDFAGGEKQWDNLRLAASQSNSTAGFWHTEGTLRSMEGRLPIGGAIRSSNFDVHAVHRYYAATGTKRGYTAAKCGNAVWLDVSTDDTGDWRPLVAQCYRGASEYIGARDSTLAEYFCAVGSRLYITQVGAQNIRWDGFFYTTGTARCLTASRTTVTGNGTTFSASGVRQGDIVFFYDHQAASWQLGATAQTITRVVSDTELTLDGNGFDTTNKNAAGTGSYVSYIIVRCHGIGIGVGGTTTATPAASATGLADDTYYYKHRYKNSVTGYSGNFSTPDTAVVVAGSRYVDVSGWGARPNDRQINQVEIFRSDDGTTYNLVRTETADATTYNFATTWQDTGVAAGAAATAADDYHNQPSSGTMAKLIYWNDRLYTRGVGTSANTFKFSTMGDVEYWPNYQFHIDEPGSTLPLLGGYVTISNQGDYINDYCVEGGAYEGTGVSGGNLLICTHTRGFRWFGWDWTDFDLIESFRVGCKSNRGLQNCGGPILWLSKDGPVRLEPGSSVPIPIYRAIWPRGLQEYITVADKDTLLSKSVTAYFNGYWLLALGEDDDTANTELWAYHVETDSWTHAHTPSQSIAIRSLATADGPTDGGELIAGFSNSLVYRLFAKNDGSTLWTTPSTGVSGQIKTRWLSLASQPNELYKPKTLGNIKLCFKKPSAAQTITLKVFTNGCTDTAEFTSASETISSTGTGRRSYVCITPDSATGRMFQLVIDGTFTKETELEWISMDYDVNDSESFGDTLG